jgi:hypothetical protein
MSPLALAISVPHPCKALTRLLVPIALQQLRTVRVRRFQFRLSQSAVP